MDSTDAAAGSSGPTAEEADKKHSHNSQTEYSYSKNGKFCFKSKSRSREDDHHRSHRHKHRRHHHGDDDSSAKRRKTRHGRAPSMSPEYNSHPSADAAFRESLFDALADDEGAAYWESVYGQPIHTYSIPSVPKGPNGELEQMSDDEYAAYVRARMWEKTHEGIMEERERLRAEKAKQKEQQQKWERETHERTQFDRAMEESLRRGRERRRAKAWNSTWIEYQRSWEKLDRLVVPGQGGEGEGKENGAKGFQNFIFWPVESGNRKDVSPEAVEEFLRHAPRDRAREQAEDDPLRGLLAVLKTERIRWHPDKIQHRYGALGIDDAVIRSVTEVFQIIDRMWNEEREKRR
ncbi:hypothetical protein MPDQ_000182 [Monascus purpureus]|uniref:Uncharacterized protein n=1 Tax=Monascus purpureus TaxID=5098 RepID=A0A507R4M7_MONPU|nr:hypothetical protein MPDQ_000182 [Monascus purpureus]BDD59228.1 hypothetical protein MAP00_004451 [Monascus purpureus]